MVFISPWARPPFFSVCMVGSSCVCNGCSSLTKNEVYYSCGGQPLSSESIRLRLCCVVRSIFATVVVSLYGSMYVW